MGGYVNVTLREEDGTVHKMGRWTNATPHMINNVGLIEKDSEHINEIIEDYQKMVRDYEENHETEDYEFNMTPAYVPNSGTAPDGYGLIVVDLMNDLILHSQGYTTFGHFHFSGVSLDRMGNVIGGSAVDRLREFYETGRILGISTPAQRGTGSFIELTDEEMDDDYEAFLDGIIDQDRETLFNQFKDRLVDRGDYDGNPTASMWGRRGEPYDFINTPDYVEVDMSPFTVTQYDENSDGLKQFKAKLEEIGFDFTEEEEQLWKERMDS